MNMLKIVAPVVTCAMLVGCGEKTNTTEEAKVEAPAPVEEKVEAPAEEEPQVELKAEEEPAPVEAKAEEKTEAPAEEVKVEEVKPEVIVRVGERSLTAPELDEQVSTMIAAQGDKIPAQYRDAARQQARNRVVQGFILENAVREKAKAMDFVVTDADRKAREDEIMARAALDPNGPKSMDDIFAAYPQGVEAAKREFDNSILIDKLITDALDKSGVCAGTQAEAEKIVGEVKAANAEAEKKLVEAEAKIKELKAQLDATPAEQLAEKFAELAKANSDCPSGKSGGSLGEFVRKQMVPEFDAVAFTQPVGVVSEPVKTKFGYHLILVNEKIPAVEAKGDAPAEPERVRASHILLKAEIHEVPSVEAVKEFLDEQAKRQFVQKFVMDLITGADVEIVSEEFKHVLPRR